MPISILVMGPPKSGKSDFVKLLAGSERLKPNATNADDLRSLAISPYFTDDGDTIHLIKFPGFNHLSPNPTDAELLIDLSVYLEGMRRRKEEISGIIYTHRIDDVGLDGFEVERNLKMLQVIAGDQQQSQALQNVVIMTTNWDQPPAAGVNRNAKETDLQDLFTKKLNISPAQFMQHDGSKWSALRIVNIVKGKIPTPLYIQTELESDPVLQNTKAAGEIVDDINAFIKAKQTEDGNLRAQIRLAKRNGDSNRTTTLTGQLDQLTDVLNRLKKEESKLEAPVDWDQAAMDNDQLNKKITELHEVATKDWKAEFEKMKTEYEKMKTEYEKMKNEYDKMKNEADMRYNTVVNERDAIQANYNSVKANYDTIQAKYDAVVAAFDTRLMTRKIKATSSFPGYDINHASFPEWLGYSAGEILNTNGHSFRTTSSNADVYRVRNSSGRIGFAQVGHFTFV